MSYETAVQTTKYFKEIAGESELEFFMRIFGPEQVALVVADATETFESPRMAAIQVWSLFMGSLMKVSKKETAH